MSENKLVVIIGITGTQGHSVAEAFLKDPSWTIRGTSRNPESDSSKAIAAKGIEVVQAELNDKDSLLKAFKGAHAVFGVTDFWGPFFNPATAERAQKEGKTRNEIAYDTEIRHGKNIADAAAQVLAEDSILERYVYSSLCDVTKWSKGEYTWVYHFDSKAKVVKYVRRELGDLSKRMSTLQVGEYATNWKKFSLLGPKKQADGTFVLSKPDKGHAKIPMIWVERDVGTFVKALIEAPKIANMLGFGSLISWREYTNIFAKTLGVNARFEQISNEDYLVELPPNMKREIAEGHAFHAEFGWDGGDPEIVHPKELGVQGTSIEDYIKQEDWTSLLES